MLFHGLLYGVDKLNVYISMIIEYFHLFTQRTFAFILTFYPIYVVNSYIFEAIREYDALRTRLIG